MNLGGRRKYLSDGASPEAGDAAIVAEEVILEEPGPESVHSTPHQREYSSNDEGVGNTFNAIDLAQIPLTSEVENKIVHDVVSPPAGRATSDPPQSPHSTVGGGSRLRPVIASSSPKSISLDKTKIKIDKRLVKGSPSAGESIDGYVSTRNYRTKGSTAEKAPSSPLDPTAFSQSSSSTGSETDEEVSKNGRNDEGKPGQGKVSADFNRLPAQLSRLWGASPPDRSKGLAVMRDMVGYREELDGILSRLVVAKVII